MQEGYWRYWGKADPSVGGFHLAAFHCLDVAAVAFELLSGVPMLRRRCATLLRLAEETVPATVAWLIALHDLGKFDLRFQMKAPEVALKLDPTRAPKRDGKGFDHGRRGYEIVDALAKAPSAAGSAWGGSGKLVPLVHAVCAHHGALFLGSKPHPGDPLSNAERSRDADAQLEFLRDLRACFEQLGATLPWRPEKYPRFSSVEFVAGLCSVADWLGSYVRDEDLGVDYFTYRAEPLPLPEYFERACAIARRLLDALPLYSARARTTEFAGLFPGWSPEGIQKALAERELPEGPALVVVEAPMGDGKTEAALHLAARWIARDDAAGVYFALPTMATSNGMFPRMQSTCEHLFGGRVNLRLAHGRARKSDAFQKLIRRRLHTKRSRDETEAEVVCARWFLSRKRALLGQAGVGTVDQAMQGALRLRHNFVRLFGLGTSVVVVDELHAYDAYMGVILERLVEWLGALRTPVVLLSATLPRVRRDEFLKAYARGAGWPERTAPETDDYPLATVLSAHGVEPISGGARTPRHVHLRAHPTPDPIATLGSTLLERAKRGALVGWVRNTVAEAQAAYEALRHNPDGVRVTLFHARFQPADRARIEAEVLERFGKDGPRAEGEVLIATQVIEQSLDLDFDLLVSDLCPIDLLLQRAGRLWRHRRDNRTARCGLERAELLVATPLPDDIAALHFGRSGMVYDRVTLWLAADTVGEGREVAIPTGLRALVEASYDPTQRAARIAAAPNTRALANAEAGLQKTLGELRAHADRAKIPEPGRDLEVLVALHEDTDESAEALTRDGESTALLLVHWEDDTPRTLAGEDLPMQFDAEAPDAWRVADRLLDEVVSIPAYPWDRVTEGLRPHGESARWEAWLEGLTRFLREVGGHRRNLVVVPMRRDGEPGSFRGYLGSEKGKRERITYREGRGLEFPDRKAPPWGRGVRSPDEDASEGESA